MQRVVGSSPSPPTRRSNGSSETDGDHQEVRRAQALLRCPSTHVAQGPLQLRLESHHSRARYKRWSRTRRGPMTKEEAKKEVEKLVSLAQRGILQGNAVPLMLAVLETRLVNLIDQI